MKFIARLLCLVVLPLLGSGAPAAKDSPVIWSVSLSNPAAKAGDEVDLVITARIAPKWIVYSSEFKGDLGPQPTQFSFVAGDAFQVVGPIVPVAPKRGRDKTWDIDYTYFTERAEFRQRVKLAARKLQGEVSIKGQLCNEGDGTCTLFSETLKL